MPRWAVAESAWRRANLPRYTSQKDALKVFKNLFPGATKLFIRAVFSVSATAVAPHAVPDREAEADKCRATFDTRIKQAVLQGPPDTVEEVKARADKIMRAAGPLGFLGRADELKRCFRHPTDMDEYIQDTIDEVRQAKRARK